MDSELMYLGSYVLDRFEEGFAVLENTNTLENITIPPTELPKSRAGDSLYWKNGEWHVDHAETKARAERIRQQFARIKARVR